MTAARHRAAAAAGRGGSHALREQALGLAAGEALWRRHQLVFAILACEAEPVDPRL